MSKEFISAVAIATKDCERYIQEIICHNFIVGFDRIIIGIDSHTTDNTESKIQQLPKNVLEKVIVEHIPRGKEHFQRLFYNLVVDKYGEQFEWLATFDDDEYFYDSRKRNVNDLLQSLPRYVGAIVVPWLTFGMSGKVLCPPKHITRLEYFTGICPTDYHAGHDDVKCIIRTKFINKTAAVKGRWYEFHHPRHFGTCIYFNGEPIKNKSCSGADQVDVENTCLVHYRSGSLEDWINRCKKWTLAEPHKFDAISGGFDIIRRNMTTLKEDARMSIYVDDLKNILSQCNRSEL